MPRIELIQGKLDEAYSTSVWSSVHGRAWKNNSLEVPGKGGDFFQSVFSHGRMRTLGARDAFSE